MKESLLTQALIKEEEFGEDTLKVFDAQKLLDLRVEFSSTFERSTLDKELMELGLVSPEEEAKRGLKFRGFERDPKRIEQIKEKIEKRVQFYQKTHPHYLYFFDHSELYVFGESKDSLLKDLREYLTTKSEIFRIEEYSEGRCSFDEFIEDLFDKDKDHTIRMTRHKGTQFYAVVYGMEIKDKDRDFERIKEYSNSQTKDPKAFVKFHFTPDMDKDDRYGTGASIDTVLDMMHFFHQKGYDPIYQTPPSRKPFKIVFAQDQKEEKQK
ncbi:MAG: hypothetical protein KAT77_01485 [Nanoarchaeota archaeon]|nr:hypothetical protein [Nanoarchaeota archaeon]